MACSLFLIACGGGGGPSGTPAFASVGQPGTGTGSSGGTTPPSVSSPAQGFFTGSTSNGYGFDAVVLETGEFWAIYGTNGVAYGAVHGSSTTSGGTFTGKGVDYFLPAGSATPSTLSGNFVSKASLDGTISSSGATFTGTYDTAYDMPAALSSIVGTWSGQVVSPAGGLEFSTFTIDTVGNFTGTVVTCTYFGSAKPRASGKAVFDVTITFGASPCLYAGKTLAGIAVLTGSGTSTTLTTAALLPDGSAGFLASGTK